MLEHPPLQLLLDDQMWLSWDELPQRERWPSLAFSGLFTDYLKALGEGAVSVELVYQGPLDATPEMTRRDVIIRVGQRLAALASTLISAEVLQRYPWLQQLGSKAIGEQLEQRLGAARTQISYRRMNDYPELCKSFTLETELLGRRYRYLFDGGDLCITEVIAGSIVQDLNRLEPGKTK